MFNGAILVGASERQGGEPFFAIDPSTGAKGEVAFHNASAADVADACALADAAFESFSTLTPEARAAFLEAVADRIMEIGRASGRERVRPYVEIQVVAVSLNKKT